MIRKCVDSDFETVWQIINDAAQSYQGIIPSDLWKYPYMSKEYLRQEIESGVVFWGLEEQAELIGVMGMQEVRDVTLIRHAYVRTTERNRGIGGKLISFLMAMTRRPVLVGTWAASEWAIRFYEKHGFTQVDWDEKELLLRKYWSIPDRQIKLSVVMANRDWFAAH